MAQNTNENGFGFQLTVHHIDTIKPRQANSFKTDSGEQVEYGHAVKFKCRNIDLVADKDFGEKEQETTIEIEIPCDSMTETVKLNNFLKELKSSQKSFSVSTTLPSVNNSVYTCKSKEKGDSFILSHSK